MTTDASGTAKPVDERWFVSHGTDVEMRWDVDDEMGYQTPNERFYIRNHTTTPRVDPDTYTLEVYGDGVLGAPGRGAGLGLSLGDLAAMPQRETTTALECTGNGRRFFDLQQGSPTPGTPWSLGAIGVARWGGVPLSMVLDRAGVLPEAVEVMATGLDDTYVVDGEDRGHVRRPLPLGKALDDVLVALTMNGEPLPPDHGSPARLVVPGWVGIASIKWLGSLQVTTAEQASPWNTIWYRMHGGPFGADGPSLTTMPVKSVFELPRETTVRRGEQVVLRGRSWSGCGAIASVEVSADGGATWRAADLVGPNEPLAWAQWRVPWLPDQRGRMDLMARAADTAGNVQPDRATYNDDGYLFDAVVRHPVIVTD